MMQLLSFFQGRDNQNSSKRLIGAIIIATALVIGATSCVIGIFHTVQDKGIIEYFLTACFASGTTLITAGVMEKLPKSTAK